MMRMHGPIKMVHEIPSPDLVPLIQLVENRVVALVRSSYGAEGDMLNQGPEVGISSPGLR